VNICTSILNIVAPIKKKRVKILKPFWMTSDYQKISNSVGNAKKMTTNVNSPEQWNYYKTIRNKASYLKAQMKARSTKKLVTNASNINQSKLYWKLFNDEVGRSKTCMNIPAIIHDGRKIDDTLENSTYLINPS